MAHGRPARAQRSRRVRLQPVPLVYGAKGYNFIGYINPEYDKLAEKQRTQTRPRGARKTLVRRGAGDHQPRPALRLPRPPEERRWPSTSRCQEAHRSSDQSGIGIRNIWTFVKAEPLGAQKDMIINTTEALNAINPLYISRRGRQLGHRPGLGPPHAHRAGRPAAALGGRERDLGRRHDRRRRSCAPA